MQEIRIVRFQPPEDVARGKTLIDWLFHQIGGAQPEDAEAYYEELEGVLDRVTDDEHEELQEYFEMREGEWKQKH